MVRILKGPRKLFGNCWGVTQGHLPPLRPHILYSTKVQEVKGESESEYYLFESPGFSYGKYSAF